MSPLRRNEFLFLALIVLAGIVLRLYPRLFTDPHLLTFQADVWYRLCLSQYLIDQGHLPVWDIRYLAYGPVPLWYPPLSIYFFAFLHHLTHLDLPTISSRILPVIESLSIVPTFLLCRELYNVRVALIASVFLLLSPAYIYWTGISTLQSFTIFAIPVSILLWIKFITGKTILHNKWLHLFLICALLSLNFLIHLSFFLHVMILCSVQIALVLEKKARLRSSVYLLIPILFCQLFTCWWWMPRHLYWWWTQALSGTSNLTSNLGFLSEYGTASGIAGLFAFAGLLYYVTRRRKAIPSLFLTPLFWALIPLLLSNNELILSAFHRPDLALNNLFKPLDGYRFYIFLSQPLAICFALMADRALDQLNRKKLPYRNVIASLAVVIAGTVLITDLLWIYKLPQRLTLSGFTTRDIHAAQWFRDHSQPGDRIIADYYSAQMFSGICGGKALLGSMLPLKNVPYPYISERNRILFDTFLLYSGEKIEVVEEILGRYRCNYIYLSRQSTRNIERLIQAVNDPLYQYPSVKAADLSTLLAQSSHFKVVYTDHDSQIIQWLPDNAAHGTPPKPPQRKPHP